jgi:peptidoglycan/xylan/chitin deacetylase (PgdA/CDA1 family)
MYHRIVPRSQAGNSLGGLVISPESFAGQMSALAQAGWRTITLAQLAEDLAAAVTPAPHTFVVTIDDGWDDGFGYALPILEANGFVATYFFIAGRIGWGNFLSVQQLRILVAAGDEIGNHTMDHVGLAGASDSRLTYEIDSASATIAAATGRWPETLAYPAGGYDLRAEAAVQACTGMKMAVIEGNSTWETWATRFGTPRIRIGPWTTPASLLAEVENPPAPAPVTTPVPATPSVGPTATGAPAPTPVTTAGPTAETPSPASGAARQAGSPGATGAPTAAN